MKAKPTKKKAAKATKKRAVTKASPKKAVKGKAKAAVPAARAKKKAAPPPKAPKAVPAPKRKKVASGNLATRRKRFASHREALLRRQADLMQAYSTSKGDSQSHLDSGTEDYIDYAVNSYAREFLLSLSELDRKQLLLVEEALRRIDRGEYGDCQQCGEPIAPKRLEVAPWVRHCVRCQELEEKGLLPQSSVLLHGEDDLGDHEEGEEEEFEEVDEEEADEEEDEEEAAEPDEPEVVLDEDSELDDEDESED